MRRLLIGLTGVVVAALGVSGCGEAEPPAEAAPAVAESLEAVDDAVARADYPAAREALDELVRDATRAGDAGRLDDDQVDAIVEAAARLEDALPAAEEPADEPSELPSEEETSPLPTPTDLSGDEDEHEDDGEGHSGKGKGKDKDKGKDKKDD